MNKQTLKIATINGQKTLGTISSRKLVDLPTIKDAECEEQTEKGKP
jgi:hypothetical protein